MALFKRFGLFFVPNGGLYDRGASWLGWDSVAGCPLPHPSLPELRTPVERLSRRPRRYGFHGTIKPPFTLAKGTDLAELSTATAAFCADQASVALPSPIIRRVGRFIAITPSEPIGALRAFAAAAVEALDPFRAPATESELAKRRKHGLSTRQEEMLQTWGYPYVMDEFRFHLTLTGPTDHADHVCDILRNHFAGALSAPLTINALCLVGEDADGFFHVVERVPLTGKRVG
ncbi:DUF1045 domain-containing protein [Gymnodinialimonas hymeniacidonis]|uniref:DUF1045 domain-containing protein n=1 Tax=Gymnodinialimonas hymeniacidonis TaxID=3126508 RepID=UPI0034C6C89F